MRDETEAVEVTLERTQTCLLEERDQLLRRQAGGAEVGENDVRLYLVGLNANPGDRRQQEAEQIEAIEQAERAE